jgi:hypothetical protein
VINSTIHFVLENPIITVLDTLLFITDLPIYAGTSPTNAQVIVLKSVLKFTLK